MILALFTASTLAFGQGSLTPPGAPTPTMKTLQQVEPRIPISSAPYTISKSGSYYLTTNLVSTGHGVVITANWVTLDLMGFTIAGDQDYSDYGVLLDGATNNIIKNVVVRNGIVCNFGTGVKANYTQDSRFNRLIITDSATSGFALNGRDGHCDDNTFTDCTISDNGDTGIFLYGGSGQCNGNSIANCSISGNGNYGVYFFGWNGQCDGNTLADCAISENENGGIFLYGYQDQCNGNSIANCTISSNGNYGVYFYGLYGQCDGNTLADCTISGNANEGVRLSGYNGQCRGNSITHCSIQKNANRGIYLNWADGNRVEGNMISDQTGSLSYGIKSSSSTDNLIVRNFCVGQTNNFSLGSNDMYGPIVTNSGALSGTNPWANFSR